MWTDDPEAEFLDDEERGPSKSQLKRDSAALQDLGEELLALSDHQLASLNLPEELLQAVRLGRTITAHGALKRQRKFIGKLLRSLDPEPIRAGLAAVRQKHAGAVRLQHRCEAWRDRLLEEGDPAVNAFLGEHPETDRQKLRQLVRDGVRERAADQPPRAARALFRWLRDMLEAADGGEEEAMEWPES